MGISKHILFLFLYSAFFLPKQTSAGSLDFWDTAVASTLTQSRSVTDSNMYVNIGSIIFLDPDKEYDSSGNFQLVAGAGFYGIKTSRYVRFMSFHGFASTDNKISSRFFESFEAGLSVYNKIHGGQFSAGLVQVSRQRYFNERLDLTTKLISYNVGGNLGSFIITLSTQSLGYKYRNYYDTTKKYHGIYIAGLALDMGFVVAKDKNVSAEFKINGKLDISFPLQRDATFQTKIALHFNNRIMPTELGIWAGYKYCMDSKNELFPFDIFFVSAMLGIRI